MTYDNYPPRYYPPPQYPTRKDVSVKAITVPILLVGSGAVALVMGTWFLATNLYTIQTSIEGIRVSLNTYIASADGRISRVESEIEKIKANRWSIKDHELWCSREEVANPGWKCVAQAGIGNNGFTTGSLPETPAPIWGGIVRRE